MASFDDTVPPLYKDRFERDRIDDLATFYSIIKATEHLERAYMKDNIDDSEYSTECSKLIGKFKNMEKTLVDGKIIVSAASFMNEYSIDCRKAKECLLTRGVPMTTLYRTPVGDSDAGAAIAETTSAIITCLDLLNLGNHAVDEVQPGLRDVMDSITKVPRLPAEFPGLEKMRYWLETLNSMRAAESVNEEQVRQLIFDLNAVYSAFMDWLKKKGR